MIRRSRKHDNIGPVFEERQTIAFVYEKFGLVFNDGPSVENPPQLAYDFFLHGFFCCSFNF